MLERDAISPMSIANSEAQAKQNFKRVKFGIWEVIYPASSRFSDTRFDIWPKFDIPKDELFTSLRNVSRLFGDVYSLGPCQTLFCVLGNACLSLTSGIDLYLSSRVIDLISKHLSGEKVNPIATLHALAVQFAWWMVVRALWDTLGRTEARFKSLVVRYFMEKQIDTSLRLDLTTANDPAVSHTFDAFRPESAWSIWRSLMQFANAMIRMTSELLLAYTLIRKHSSAQVFVLLCLMEPIVRMFSRDYGMWDTYVTLCINSSYKRLVSLRDLALGKSYRFDVVSDDAGKYIKNEYQKCMKELENESLVDAQTLWYDGRRPVSDALSWLNNNFPNIYFAIAIFYGHHGTTFASLAILQKSTATVKTSIGGLNHWLTRIKIDLQKLKELYSFVDMQSGMKDGAIAYPSPDRVGTSAGMGVEYRNVSFAYPATTKRVLENLSFTILPGQMVVIVGVNGSGKSSTVKLFDRLYDPTEGEILVDGLPLSSYKIEDIRRAIAVLRQDHSIYPLSLSENIQMGHPDRIATAEEIDAATRAGGSHAFIEKLPKKLDTTLNPVRTSSMSYRTPPRGLKEMVTDAEKCTDISGGEKQRLAASRTFLRLSSGDVRFLCADEPTSALDPEGEHELLTRLRGERQGKTLVFITHRFGHLTKYADLILCLKDGRLVEQGTHYELMKKEGEYARLHKIQTEAFVYADSEST